MDETIEPVVSESTTAAKHAAIQHVRGQIAEVEEQMKFLVEVCLAKNQNRLIELHALKKTLEDSL